jgi:HSP20 family protein
MALLKRESHIPESVDVFGRFDRMFDEWTRILPFGGSTRSSTDDVIRIDEYREDGALVIRADLPGIDPDQDVDLTITDGMLRLTAERQEEQEKESKGYLRRELRYGRFARSIPLPEGVTETDINATYRNGTLEIRIPVPDVVGAAEPKKIAIKRN